MVSIQSLPIIADETGRDLLNCYGILQRGQHANGKFRTRTRGGLLLT